MGDFLNNLNMELLAVILAWFLTLFTFKLSHRTSKIGDMVSESLIEARDIEYEAFCNTKYTTDDNTPQNVINFFMKKHRDKLRKMKSKKEKAINEKFEILFSGIMSNMDTLKAYCEKISTVSEEHDKNLDFLSVAFLHYGAVYFKDLRAYIEERHWERYTQEIGIFLYDDMLKWHKDFEKHLTKKINNPRYKIHDRSKLKRLYLKSDILKDYKKISIFYKLRKEPQCEEMKLLNILIDSIETKSSQAGEEPSTQEIKFQSHS